MVRDVPKPYKPFTTGDPLTWLVKGRFRTNSWLVMIIIIVLPNLLFIWLATSNNVLFTKGNRAGLLQDPAWWVYQFISLPVTLVFFLWLPAGIVEVLDGLRRNRAILSPQGKNEAKAFQDFTVRFDRVYSHWGWIALSIIIVTLYMSFAVTPEHRFFQGWQTFNTAIFTYHEAYWYFFYLIGTLVAIRVMLAIFWFNRLFKEFRVEVKVLHPDGAGGLSPLASFSVRVGYLIGAFGVAAGAAIWSHYAYLMPGLSFGLGQVRAAIPLIGLYILLAPVVFFTPIGSAHSAMKIAKDKFLLDIGSQFDVDFVKMQAAIGKDSGELAGILDKVEQLQRIHKIGSGFPVWPFNTSSIVGFFTWVLSPLLLALIPYIISFISQ